MKFLPKPLRFSQKNEKDVDYYIKRGYNFHMRNRVKQQKVKGFTLLEMLIVIGLLVIVTTVAVPKFKKCYDDIHINKTLDDLDSLLQSTRSYYLIMNEVPEDENPARIPEEVAWAMQPNFLGSKGEGYYNISIKNWSGDRYDWDYWTDRPNFHPQWGLLFKGEDKISKSLFVEKMRNRFGLSLNECTEGSATSGQYFLFLSLLEIPKVSKDKKNKENRYF